jgi:hypothetical protein
MFPPLKNLLLVLAIGVGGPHWMPKTLLGPYDHNGELKKYQLFETAKLQSEDPIQYRSLAGYPDNCVLPQSIRMLSRKYLKAPESWEALVII